MPVPIRVAHVMGKMVGGGLEAVVMNYYRHVDRSRVQFDLLVDADSTLVPREEVESLGGRVIEVPPYQDVAASQRELCRLFRRERWPIVHSHMNALSVFPLRAAARAGVPVRIAHSHSTSGRGEYAKNVLKAALRTQANRYPTHRFACSRLAGDWLFGEGAPYEVFPNAIDLSRFARDSGARREIRFKLGIASRTLAVGHLGRFVAQKNHAFLLDIFSELHRLEPDSVLLLAGDGPLQGEVREKAAALGLRDAVRFLGQRADAERLYQAFDIFCLPSLYEGLPVVGVECQASGTPILASTEVTNETAVTSLMEFESSSFSAEGWARHLLRMRGRTLSEGDLAGLSKFDIVLAAHRLQKTYETYLFAKGCTGDR